MEKKLILIVFFSLLFFSNCKEKKTKVLNEKKETLIDTIYFETQSKMDTILLTSKNRNESIWINKVLYKKECGEKSFLIVYSLSDNNYELIENFSGTQNKKILGQDISIEKSEFNRHTLIKVEDKTQNSGHLIKSISIFLVKNDCTRFVNEEFSLISNDDGKTFNKELELIKSDDSLFYILKDIKNP